MGAAGKIITSDDVARQCYESPVHFARVFFRYEPTPQQCAMMESIARPGSRTAVRSGHGTGKSRTLAATALWFLSTRGARDAVVACTAPTAPQLREILWREIKILISAMPPQFRGMYDVTEDKVRVAGSNGEILARTARPEKPEALQGLHAPEILFIIDEAAGVANNVFEVARGALSTPSARVAMCGNPTRVSGYFFEAFHKNSEYWTCIALSCLDAPEWLVDPSYAEGVAAEFGEDSDVYRVRVLGEFPRHGDLNLISREWVESAMTAKPYPAPDFLPRTIGVDPSYGGSDRATIVYRHGQNAECMFAQSGIDKDSNPGRYLAERALKIITERDVTAAYVDMTGIGTACFEALRQLAPTTCKVYGLHFAQAQRDHVTFADFRTEIWWKMKEWFRAGSHVHTGKWADDFLVDVTSPQVSHRSNSKLFLEPKDAMKKRGMRSPDWGDALAMTLYHTDSELTQKTATRDYSGQADWRERRFGR